MKRIENTYRSAHHLINYSHGKSVRFLQGSANCIEEKTVSFLTCMEKQKGGVEIVKERNL
jgi:hypothetical protein